MDKFVYIKTLEKPLDKNGKPYTKITDQDLQVWSIFRNETKFEIGKAYLFTYHLNERNFPEIENITSLVNIFQEKALRQVANINDFKRDLFMSLSYSKDLLVGQIIHPTELFTKAEEIYKWVTEKATDLMPKENDNG